MTAPRLTPPPLAAPRSAGFSSRKKRNSPGEREEREASVLRAPSIHDNAAMISTGLNAILILLGNNRECKFVCLHPQALLMARLPRVDRWRINEDVGDLKFKYRLSLSPGVIRKNGEDRHRYLAGGIISLESAYPTTPKL